MRTSGPQIEHNICTHLAAVCSNNADRTAIIYPNYGPSGFITYRQFLDTVEKAAALLIDQGMQPGQRLLICLDSQPELIILAFACAYAGVTAVIVNNRYSAEELEHLIDDSQAVHIITNHVYGEVFGQLLERVDHSTIVYRGDVPDRTLAGSKTQFHDFLALTGEGKCVVPVHEMHPAFIFYTSGTTATPKGVVITHAHALWAAEQNIAHLGVDEEDTTFLFSPLHHVMGFSYQLLTAIFSGGSILLRKTFNPARFWDDAIKHHCTWTAVMPYVVHALAVFPTPGQHFFRFWGFGSRNVTVESMFRVNTVGWWGMTELFAVGCLTNYNDETAPNFSVGRSVYEHRLVDTKDGGGPFDAEINGDLQIKGDRGKTIFLGYWHKHEETEQAFTKDGWLITGDRFFQDKRRTLFFDVRTKDIIRVAGENVSAAEIEFTVYQSGMVKEVAVVAGEDKVLGEVPVACVILNDDGMLDRERARATILERCRQRLADFKRPRDIVLLTDFPRAELGKIAKNKLRELVKSGRDEEKSLS